MNGEQAVTHRFPLLLLPALCALASCGIPTTGAVDAGAPAGGVVPTVRVYFVTGDVLVAVDRRTTAPVGVEAALDLLLRGPSRPEREKGMTTHLAAPTTPLPARRAPDGNRRPGAPGPPEPVRVSTAGDRVLVEVSPRAGKMSGTAVAQIVCTAVAAQRVAHPGAEPDPVTVTTADHRRVEASPSRCPGDGAGPVPAR
ncbi:hypothetical protein [Streptomyces sp. NPDC057838]|uniref:hypothetical protein n=1 Tax=unclassified Streptomyces TaxID=2593676 RepID=UPI0036AA46C1